MLPASSWNEECNDNNLNQHSPNCAVSKQEYMQWDDSHVYKKKLEGRVESRHKQRKIFTWTNTFMGSEKHSRQIWLMIPLHGSRPFNCKSRALIVLVWTGDQFLDIKTPQFIAEKTAGCVFYLLPRSIRGLTICDSQKCLETKTKQKPQRRFSALSTFMNTTHSRTQEKLVPVQRVGHSTAKGRHPVPVRDILTLIARCKCMAGDARFCWC